MKLLKWYELIKLKLAFINLIFSNFCFLYMLLIFLEKKPVGLL